MEIGMTCFTIRGTAICRLLCRRFGDTGTECTGYVSQRFWKPEWEAEGTKPQDKSFSEWTGSMFGQKRALVFIGVAGITARATAPFVRDKMTDPPVVAVDEAGHFCISLLSGHVGGANELAERMACWLQGIPVITIATDINGIFVVDVSAARRGPCITDRRKAKEISVWLLDGGKVGFFCDSECRRAEGASGAGTTKNGSSDRGAENVGDDTEGIRRHNICMNSVCRYNVWITFRNSEGLSHSPDREAIFLRLVPKVAVVGMGCRKGTPPDIPEGYVLKVLERGGVDPVAVKALSTIDIKAGEEAVTRLACRYGWELRTFISRELLAVEGEFRESDFVGSVVGVGDVCERLCTARGGRPLIYKQAGKGVTAVTAIEPATEKLDIEKCSWIRYTFSQFKSQMLDSK